MMQAKKRTDSLPLISLPSISFSLHQIVADNTQATQLENRSNDVLRSIGGGLVDNVQFHEERPLFLILPHLRIEKVPRHQPRICRPSMHGPVP